MGLNEKFFRSADENEPFFNTVLYTGNETSQSITGTGFQPDLIWVKNRDTTNNHLIFDSIRGNSFLIPNDTFAEDTSSSNTMSSFDNDGFSISGGGGSLNNGSDDYVAWCWKAGGAAVSNTDGTITSQVSANVDLGFSIVSYTGSASATVGHGLDSIPELIITKQTASTGVWVTYSKTLGKDKLLELNSNSAAQSVSNYWGTSAPTSTVFGLSPNSAHYNANGAQIAYCFTSKSGVSKVGSYTGGSGATVNTGFRPSWVMVKKTDSSVDGDWVIYDDVRGEDEYLLANTNGQEASYDNLDFTATGFNLKANNASLNKNGAIYIYYAIA